MAARRLSRSYSRMSRPFSRISPSSGSYRRVSSLTMVVLPAPFWPTSATVSSSAMRETDAIAGQARSCRDR